MEHIYAKFIRKLILLISAYSTQVNALCPGPLIHKPILLFKGMTLTFKGHYSS